jgi:uncharacterized protein
MTRDDRPADGHVWERGWTGHEAEQLQRLARLPFAEKLRWLEEGQRVAGSLSRAARRPSAVHPPASDVRRASFANLGSELPDLDLLVLFGSAARGRMRRMSDVDVAVQCDAAADLDALFMALAPRLKTSRLDLVDLRHAGPLLAFEVARSGQVLFEREPGVFRTFQSLASRRYADTRKLRDAQKRSLQVFLALGRRS